MRTRVCALLPMDGLVATPPGAAFPFSAPPTGHLAIHLGPVLLITRLGLRMRTTVPAFGDVLCPEKGYQYTAAFFLALPLSLSHPLFTSPPGFFTLVATKGPLSVGRRARLFYTPNVIQPRSYLRSPFLCPPVFLRLRLFRSAAFLKPPRRCTGTTKKITRGRVDGDRAARKIVLAL